MRHLSLEELRDLTPAYVMDTLSSDEREAFESALATSGELKAEVSDFRAVVERLSTEQSIAPSPNVRTRFLDRIASEKTVPFARPSASSNQPSTSSAESAESAESASSLSPAVEGDSRQKPANAQTRQSASSPAWWTTGILATALAASVVIAVTRNSELATTRRELAALAALREADSTKLQAREAELETVLEAERDLRIVHLTTQTPGGAGIQFFWNLKQGRGLLHAFRLPPAARGRAYQMWFIRDGKPVPVKVFNSDPDGHGLVYGFEVPKDLKGVTLMAVTLEPEGGSALPTSVPFMTGTVDTQ